MGGEEFVVVLHGAPEDAAFRLGEKLRMAVESIGMPHPGSPSGRVTVSVGVATIAPTTDAALSELLDAADSALYEAKRAGRNRVVAASGRQSPADRATRCLSAVETEETIALAFQPVAEILRRVDEGHLPAH